jgi:hypothetical protein
VYWVEPMPEPVPSTALSVTVAVGPVTTPPDAAGDSAAVVDGGVLSTWNAASVWVVSIVPWVSVEKNVRLCEPSLEIAIGAL